MSELHPGDFVWGSGQGGSFKGADDLEIQHRSFVKPDARAGIVISSGRTECMLKYAETIEELGEAGYSVYILDHRGQGFSGRMTEDPQIGHVEDFDHYVQDLKTFVDDVVVPSHASASTAAERPLFLLAHSMGGCIATLYMQQYRRDFAAAVLCSPMHQPSLGLLGDGMRFLSGLANLFGRGDSYVGVTSLPYEDRPHAQVTPMKQAHTHSERRYEAVRRLYAGYERVRLGGPSSSWLSSAINAARRSRQRAAEIETPILLLQAGDDGAVTAAGQNRFHAAAPGCVLERIEGAYHELLIEEDPYRSQAMSRILGFLAEHSG